jgi:flagellar protein FlgJ
MDPILMTGALGSPKSNSQVATGTNEAAHLGDAAKEFEGVFLGLLLKAMRGSIASGGLLKEGSDTQMYREMFDQELGRSLARAGGIGLSQMILRDQARRQAADAVNPAKPVSAIEPKDSPDSGS